MLLPVLFIEASNYTGVVNEETHEGINYRQYIMLEYSSVYDRVISLSHLQSSGNILEDMRSERIYKTGWGDEE